MNETLADLARSIEALRASPRVRVGRDDARFDLALESGEFGPESMFEATFGYPCPAGLRAGLYLPDEVTVDWRHDERVGGELSLSNHLLTPDRRLDESLLRWTLEGIALAETRIVDAVLVEGGPQYTLVHAPDGRLSEALYLFDTRRLLALEIGYEDYLRRLALAKGLVRWQLLYCRDLRIGGFERAALARGLEFLRAEFPDRPYEELAARLAERSA